MIFFIDVITIVEYYSFNCTVSHYQQRRETLMVPWRPNVLNTKDQTGKVHQLALKRRSETRADNTLTKALAQIGLFVDEDFGRDHVSKRHEHLQKILVPKLLGQVVDEQVGTLWPYSIW